MWQGDATWGIDGGAIWHSFCSNVFQYWHTDIPNSEFLWLVKFKPPSLYLQSQKSTSWISVYRMKQNHGSFLFIQHQSITLISHFAIIINIMCKFRWSLLDCDQWSSDHQGYKLNLMRLPNSSEYCETVHRFQFSSSAGPCPGWMPRELYCSFGKFDCFFL